MRLPQISLQPLFPHTLSNNYDVIDKVKAKIQRRHKWSCLPWIRNILAQWIGKRTLSFYKTGRKLWLYPEIFYLLIHVSNQKKNSRTFSLDSYIIISQLTFLLVSIRKISSSEDQTKAVPHKTKLATFLCRWLDVKESGNHNFKSKVN